VVFGNGPNSADLLILGEAPGAREDECGLPFVGTAGEALNKLLVEAGLDRGRAYVTNVVKCRPTRPGTMPPKDRPPSPLEIRVCSRYLDGQLAAVRPRVILALGGTAIRQLLGPDALVRTSRLHAHKVNDIQVVATYHPSSLNRKRGRRALIPDPPNRRC
jgi:uracil-DNA glycosylase family 4